MISAGTSNIRPEASATVCHPSQIAQSDLDLVSTVTDAVPPRDTVNALAQQRGQSAEFLVRNIYCYRHLKSAGFTPQRRMISYRCFRSVPAVRAARSTFPPVSRSSFSQ